MKNLMAEVDDVFHTKVKMMVAERGTTIKDEVIRLFTKELLKKGE